MPVVEQVVSTMGTQKAYYVSALALTADYPVSSFADADINTTFFAPGDSMRGGARKPVRSSQEQRSVMLTWAIDKAKRELPQISVPTITMMMKAEMRTVSSALHSRSAMQTYQILQAAYRRANLQLPREVQPVTQSRSRTSSPVRNSDDQNPPRQDQPSAEENEDEQPGPAAAQQELATSTAITGEHSQCLINELAAMRQAMANQAVITGQILDIMSAMPKNSHYMALVQAVKAQSEAHCQLRLRPAVMSKSLPLLKGLMPPPLALMQKGSRINSIFQL